MCMYRSEDNLWELLLSSHHGVLGREHRPSGLAARVFTDPPGPPLKCWDYRPLFSLVLFLPQDLWLWEWFPASMCSTAASFVAGVLLMRGRGCTLDCRTSPAHHFYLFLYPPLSCLQFLWTCCYILPQFLAFPPHYPPTLALSHSTPMPTGDLGLPSPAGDT